MRANNAFVFIYVSQSGVLYSFPTFVHQISTDTQLTIKVREVIDVSQDVLRYVTVFLQTKLKNLKGNRFILCGEMNRVLEVRLFLTVLYTKRTLMCTYLAAVVLHQRCGHIDVVTRAWILSGLFKDGAT